MTIPSCLDHIEGHWMLASLEEVAIKPLDLQEGKKAQGG